MIADPGAPLVYLMASPESHVVVWLLGWLLGCVVGACLTLAASR